MKKLLLLPLLLVALISSCKKESQPPKLESITLNEASIDIKPNQSVQLTATTIPSNAVDGSLIWSVSDSLIASVSQQGMVKAKKVGETMLTVKNSEGNVATTCKLIVTPVAMGSLTLNKNALSLDIGGSELLTATVNPPETTNKKLIWTSSDPLVAFVSETGLVSAISVGKAQITVKSEDGKISALCEVTVNPIMVEGVALNKSMIELAEGSTEQLHATISPPEASNKKLIWTSSNPLVVTVTDQGLISAVSPGEAVVTVATVDGNHKATCKVQVKDIISFVSGYNVAGMIISSSVRYTLGVYFNNETPELIAIEKVQVLDGNGALLIETTDPIYLTNSVSSGRKNVNIASYTFGIPPQDNWVSSVFFTVKGKSYKMSIVGKTSTISAD